jgi:serine/threonine protein phosphatase PrpC
MNMRKEFVVEMRDPLFEEPKKVEVRALSEAKEKKSVEIGSATEPSENHPDHNEDRFTVGHDMLAVYDGMGGSDRGEEAAIFAKNEIERGIASLGEQSSPEMLAHSLSNIIIETNKKMHVSTATKEDGTHRGVEDMGSTVSLLKVWRGKNGEKKLVVANVGDSRIYRLREGRLEQLTEDDGIPNAILADKEMTKNLSETSRQKLKDLFDTFETEDDLKKLSQEERNVFDLMFKFRKSVSQALGAAEVVPRTYIYDIEPGDEYIGTSDGIHDPLSNKRIERSLKNNPERSMVQKAKDLIADVKKRIMKVLSAKNTMIKLW